MVEALPEQPDQTALSLEEEKTVDTLDYHLAQVAVVSRVSGKIS
jgi:hypothetical protein